MGQIIYGNEIAKTIKEKLATKIKALHAENKRCPKLSVIFVGEAIGSTSYVAGKEKACNEVGILNTTYRYPSSVSEQEILSKIKELNQDSSVDGILVQLPLPKHINETNVLFSIDPTKDVDGFHPFNIGKMMLGVDTFLPCTPKGVICILEAMGLDDLSGKNAIVLGRSNIVGKPMAQLLVNKNATVTIAHSKTKNIEECCANADIVIAAVGVPKLVKASWIKEGAVVIDVGVNRDANNKLCGDVDLEDVLHKVNYITPVPKGVGPMTIAMLLQNTLESYEKKEDGHYGV